MLSVSNGRDVNVYKFLSRWTLFGGLAELALVGMMMAVIMPAGQDPNLSFDFVELLAATRIPALFRLAMTLDAFVWLAIGGMLLIFAVLFSRKLPVFAAIIAACGIAQLIGFIGAFMRLEGTSHLAANYLASSGDGRAMILQSFLVLQSVINAHFDAGSWIYATAYLLVARLIWMQSDFPRWIAVPMTLAAVFILLGNFLTLVGIENQFVLFLLSLLFEITTFLGTALVFWRRSQLV